MLACGGRWPRSEEEKARARHCGFVAFVNRDDAGRAKDEMNETEVSGYVMRIGWGKAVAKPSPALTLASVQVKARRRGVGCPPLRMRGPVYARPSRVDDRMLSIGGAARACFPMKSIQTAAARAPFRACRRHVRHTPMYTPTRVNVHRRSCSVEARPDARALRRFVHDCCRHGLLRRAQP